MSGGINSAGGKEINSKPLICECTFLRSSVGNLKKKKKEEKKKTNDI